jgi:hypothetical protein
MVTMALGLVGAILGFVINSFYSLFHFLGRISGITADSSHFFIGLGLTIIAVIGSLAALVAPELSALILLVATIGFFFIMGWWAIIPAIFLLVAAWFALRGRQSQQHPGGTAQT